MARSRVFAAGRLHQGGRVAQVVLTEIYIEALLVDEELADQVWEAWDKGEIDDFTAYFAWTLISFSKSEQSVEVRRQ